MNYNSIIIVDDKIENLKVEARSRVQAIRLVVRTYRDFVKANFIKTFKIVNVQ